MALKSRLILSAGVVLAVLAVATTSASVKTRCVPGSDIPYKPLRACREFLASKVCSLGPLYASAGMLKRRCCEQLSRIPAYCRCEALRILMDGVETPQGLFEGGLLQDIPGCPRFTRKYTMGLVDLEECNLETIHGSPHCPTPITRGVVV